ncbi:glycoside hydrolase family 5 protein [Flammula alnicola]|nr:glycoside hydrolase family 5 protein [Flammula alnicola]
MPQIPSTSPATGKPLPPSYIHTTSVNFVDNSGRTLLLRGVNLSGASKAPVGHLSYLLEDFWESAELGGESFIGRPLNIDDGSADVHLARLKGWGFNLLRFPFTWEALEHEAPGKYDHEFMDYTIRVLCKCRDYGFRVYMDPHQDTWSRFSGGSGAPYWTLAACGINARHITATQAAIVHCEYPFAHEPDPASLPAMVWSTNYGRLLSQTVFTLFFAGRDFAPNCIIDGVNIQDYLQNHFIEACGQLVDRIKAFDGGSLFDDCIIGWDSLNEPFEGLCGWEDLHTNPTKQGSTLKKGTYPTPAQSLRLGMGQAQTVENWTFGVMGPSRNGTVTIDPKGRKIWADPMVSTSQENPHEPSGDEVIGELPDGTHPRWGWKRDVSKWPLGKCIWAQHGVWDVETGYILRPDYFHFNPFTGVEVEFLSDHWKPHWLAYAQRIRQSHEEAIIFVQPPVFAPPPKFDEGELKGRCAYSPHYYDGLTLVTRHWNWFNADALGLLRGKYSSTLQAVKIGEKAIRKSLHEQLGYLQADVIALGHGAYPTVIGEIGTPFDMDDKRSYGWTDGGKHKGNYSNQEKALDASLNACDAWSYGEERDSLNFTIWTYVGDDHTHEWGDGWNMEDLSLWSLDDLTVDEDEDEGDEPKARRMRTLSRASVSSTSSTTSSKARLPVAGVAGHSTNPYTLLTHGARAVRAFARPWPVKVVGRAKDVRFDIGKGSFKLVVSVGWEDRIQNGSEDSDEREPLGTEVYIPLVHYAHPRLLEEDERSRLQRKESKRRWIQKDTGADGDANSITSTSTLAEDGEADERDSPPSLHSGSTAVDAKAEKSHIPVKESLSQPPSPTPCAPISAPLLIRDSTPDLIDVEVKVSAGRFDVRGQTLFWWYDVPAEGEPPKEYVLEVKRRGGVLKPPAKGRRADTTAGNTWYEQLCPEEGCVIA